MSFKILFLSKCLIAIFTFKRAKDLKIFINMFDLMSIFARAMIIDFITVFAFVLFPHYFLN